MWVNFRKEQTKRAPIPIVIGIGALFVITKLTQQKKW